MWGGTNLSASEEESSRRALALAPAKYTGTQVNYFMVCSRKTWLFSHDMQMEHESDLVRLGRLVHETRFPRKLKEIQVGRIKIDFFDRKYEVHEIKKSRRMEKAHVYQLLYYLYYLKHEAGVEAKGVLNYPLTRRRVEVELTQEKEQELEGILGEMHSLVSLGKPPPPLWVPYCKYCSYHELCWS